MFDKVQNVSQLSYTVIDFLIVKFSGYFFLHAKILTNVNFSVTLALKQFVIYFKWPTEHVNNFVKASFKDSRVKQTHLLLVFCEMLHLTYQFIMSQNSEE